jgi:predicted nuclease of predicted toxin-antitoxin system
MPERKRIHFFTDNDVANQVGDTLISLGHQVTRLRDVMLDDSPDEIVATACRDRQLVLVTHNVRDFRRIVRDQTGTTNAVVGALHRVELKCDQATAHLRIAEEIAHIEQDWARFQTEPECEMRITIENTFIRLNRDRKTGRPNPSIP